MINRYLTMSGSRKQMRAAPGNSEGAAVIIDCYRRINLLTVMLTIMSDKSILPL